MRPSLRGVLFRLVGRSVLESVDVPNYFPTVVVVLDDVWVHMAEDSREHAGVVADAFAVDGPNHVPFLERDGEVATAGGHERGWGGRVPGPEVLGRRDSGAVRPRFVMLGIPSCFGMAFFAWGGALFGA